VVGRFQTLFSVLNFTLPELMTVHVATRLEQVVVVVPVDADIDKAQDVAQENRQQRFDRVPIRAVRHFQFQNHDRDDDGEHAITERFKPVLSMAGGYSIHCWRTISRSLSVVFFSTKQPALPW
jgi:hypothetical protein